MQYVDLSGPWMCEIPGGGGEMRLPGTLDESGIGFPDNPARQWKVDEVERIGFWKPGDPIVTRLTRKRTFEGRARISRVVQWDVPEGKRIFVECERARHLRLLVNGREALLFEPASISTPYVFEVTGLVNGRDEFVFLSDNSYPGWPRDAMVYSSAASDETQTNWNGLLGYVRIRVEEPDFISAVRVWYPDGENKLRVQVELSLARDWEGDMRLASPVLMEDAVAHERLTAGRQEKWYFHLELRADIKKWDIDEGNLSAMTVSLEGMEPKTVTFGLRDFRGEDGRLTINGRRFFLRGEANCAVFPETGYIPMETEAWKDIIRRYQAYGVNCLRFHSHCPPEAAFAAADELGILMQPELSHWNPSDAFAAEEAKRYYETELMQILKMLANHPSFVMLTLGNELHADAAGHAFMDRLVNKAKQFDSSRLYANGSNPHYGALGPDPASGFYTSPGDRGRRLRLTSANCHGRLNQEYPNTRRNYDREMSILRQDSQQPVFPFEVGQYEVLPDFDEIGDFRGVTGPENLKHIQRKVSASGLEETWKRMVEATGESALLCYRAEVEAALATKDFSGISLLGLQDFPGQGTALVGMMNSHLRPKPFDFAKAKRFRAFFRDALPMALLPRFTFVAGETLEAEIKMANYGKTNFAGSCVWTLSGSGFFADGSLPVAVAPMGGLTSLGTLRIPLEGFERAEKLILTLSFCGIENTYPLWVYPDIRPECPETVYECRVLDEKARQVLRDGGNVFLAPDATADALPHAIPAQFSPDFWSVCTFPTQAGGMGQLIDAAHPLFRTFPTETYNNWQWWPMANTRAMILPERIQAIITEMDSYAFLRPMAKLFECRCGGGKLMVSSMGLHELEQYPEARALRQAIFDYMASPVFEPIQELGLPWIESILMK
ncbi:MAG: hypothetical protein IK099_00550 [Clostridia bacterium]|nr:hypothetical protein [Clostridia bacterium]